MKDLIINTGEPYHALIGAALIGRLDAFISGLAPQPGKILFVTDSNVGPLYADQAAAALGGRIVGVHTVAAGEEHKTPETLIGIVRACAQAELTRADLILALGGGVVGDMAGFASAIYQRGMRFVQCPTTLLSAVDASVGGKTAVDLPEGKNLIGAFHQPSLVVCDTDAFRTLSEARVADGAAEIVKHAMIADPDLFDRMKDPAWRTEMEDIVARNIEIKRSFVVGDERDHGRRQLLNFGHTIGHAVEAWSGFSLSHGQSVAVGMVMETRAARKLGFSACSEAPLAGLLAQNGLPTSVTASADELLRFALHDKKRQDQTVTVAVPVRVGSAELKRLNLAEFTEYLRAGTAA